MYVRSRWARQPVKLYGVLCFSHHFIDSGSPFAACCMLSFASLASLLLPAWLRMVKNQFLYKYSILQLNYTYHCNKTQVEIPFFDSSLVDHRELQPFPKSSKLLISKACSQLHLTSVTHIEALEVELPTGVKILELRCLYWINMKLAQVNLLISTSLGN